MTLLEARPLLSVMDTTLRDGEQTPSVAFDADDKLALAEALLCAGVDRIEIGSARVSEGEAQAARRIAAWAQSRGLLERVELLGYCDGERSVRWIADTSVTRFNLLLKGSERHCRQQLGCSLAEHVARARATLDAARRHGLTLSGVYLEDWSRGISESPAYVDGLLTALAALGVARVYLADTLGVLSPDAVHDAIVRTRRAHPTLALELHAHDDYGLATANCLAAAKAGVHGVHTTVNGLGERAGNASLAEVVVALRDHAGRATAVDEHALVALSRLVAARSGRAVPGGAPIVGEHVFTQTAGIHADGDAKGDLYVSALCAERFGQRRQYALGKLAGRASLRHHLSALGLVVSDEQCDALLSHVVALGDGKRGVCREDLPPLLEQVRARAARRAAPQNATSAGACAQGLGGGAIERT